MFSINPFAELSASISPTVIQTYVVVMILLVAAGTLFDIVHKKSAKYFFQNWQKAKSQGTDVGAGKMVSIAVQTAVIDAITSGEFCNQRRRVAHLLSMYGFVLYAAATAVMVFGFPTATTTTPAIWPQLWHIGALMVCVGGYWFWFFIRVDVLAEGHSPFRIVRADLFILSLVVSVTLGFIWSYLQASGSGATTIMLGAYILTTTVLFGSVPWSKFSHMFYKPAAAFEKRFSAANGTRSNLPAPSDKPATFGDPRTQPNHY